jgi:hypothetical protein
MEKLTLNLAAIDFGRFLIFCYLWIYENKIVRFVVNINNIEITL